jgi:long-chain acyl-CoA synthetase
VLYEHFRRIAWIADLLFNPFPFPRKEGENIRPGLEHMGRLLDQGWSIGIFPEGQMSESGKLLPLKRGAGLIGTEMGAPIVPVKITGTNVILPYAKVIPRKRGTVTVRFGEPLRFKRSDSPIEATERIAEELGRL